MKKVNFNSIVKVKLTDFGKDVYYHKDDELILRGFKIEKNSNYRLQSR